MKQQDPEPTLSAWTDDGQCHQIKNHLSTEQLELVLSSVEDGYTYMSQSHRQILETWLQGRHDQIAAAENTPPADHTRSTDRRCERWR